MIAQVLAGKFFIKGMDDQEQGPIREEEIIEAIRAGQVTSQTHVRHALFKSWRPASEFKEFSTYFASDECSESPTITDLNTPTNSKVQNLQNLEKIETSVWDLNSESSIRLRKVENKSYPYFDMDQQNAALKNPSNPCVRPTSSRAKMIEKRLFEESSRAAQITAVLALSLPFLGVFGLGCRDLADGNLIRGVLLTILSSVLIRLFFSVTAIENINQRTMTSALALLGIVVCTAMYFGLTYPVPNISHQIINHVSFGIFGQLKVNPSSFANLFIYGILYNLGIFILLTAATNKFRYLFGVALISIPLAVAGMAAYQFLNLPEADRKKFLKQTFFKVPDAKVFHNSGSTIESNGANLRIEVPQHWGTVSHASYHPHPSTPDVIFKLQHTTLPLYGTITCEMLQSPVEVEVYSEKRMTGQSQLSSVQMKSRKNVSIDGMAGEERILEGKDLDGEPVKLLMVCARWKVNYYTFLFQAAPDQFDANLNDIRTMARKIHLLKHY